MRASAQAHGDSPWRQVRDTLRLPAWGSAARRLGSWLREDDGTWTRGAPPRLQLFLLLFGLAMILISLLGDQGLFAYRALSRESAALHEEVSALQLKELDLAREIRLLRSDPGTIERLARQRLGLVKPGETVIQLPRAKKE